MLSSGHRQDILILYRRFRSVDNDMVLTSEKGGLMICIINEAVLERKKSWTSCFSHEFVIEHFLSLLLILAFKLRIYRDVLVCPSVCTSTSVCFGLALCLYL